MSPSHPSGYARRALHLFVSATICAFASNFVAAEPLAKPKAELSTLDFVDADIVGVARAIALILNRPVLVDPRVKGTITLYTEQGVTATQAYDLFLGTLRGLGYAAIEVNGLIRVVPEADAKLMAAGPASAVLPRRADAVTTQIFSLVHENASNLVPVLRPLITPNNTINANAGNNSLIITDYASNLARIGTLIGALDTPSATDVEVIQVHHGLASDLAASIVRLMPGGASAAAQPATPAAPAAATAGNTGASVIADPKLNALLVRAANPTQLASIRALAARLDIAGSTGAGGGNIHVVYLKNAEATRLAAVLRAAASNDAGRQSATGGGSGMATTSSPTSALGSGLGAGASSSSTASGASQAGTAPVGATAQPSIGGYIQADPASNALIITAPEPHFQELRAVIEELDTRRAQLYVESLVVEVDAARAVNLGLQWKQIFNISESTLSTVTLSDIADALHSMSGTNILSTANVVTLDNEEAKIVVGQNVPFVTGSYTTTGSSTASPFQTVERKDVGITLRIRPQIGQGGNIRMAILQESSSVSASTTPGTTNAGPTTNKRSIESTVVVNNGKIIVLGGLIEDSLESEAGQVPVLSEIPYVGALFRYLTRTRKKTNLLVFLRPHVMPDESTTTDISLDRYDFIRARQKEQPKDVKDVLREVGPPVLPDVPGTGEMLLRD